MDQQSCTGGHCLSFRIPVILRSNVSVWHGQTARSRDFPELRQAMDEHDLETEIAEFNKIHDALRDQFGPQAWVVISEGTLQGHFPAFADAATFAATRFQDRPTLVRQVDSAPVHVPYVLMRG
jgi:hypothetical protein